MYYNRLGAGAELTSAERKTVWRVLSDRHHQFTIIVVVVV